MNAVSNAVAAYQAKNPSYNGRPDYALTAALTKVSPEQQKKIKTQAQDFEAMFINSMFSQMTSGLKGDGPFGDTVGTGQWRSMLTDQYSKDFAKAGGLGVSQQVYRSLIMQQAQGSSTAGQLTNRVS